MALSSEYVAKTQKVLEQPSMDLQTVQHVKVFFSFFFFCAVFPYLIEIKKKIPAQGCNKTLLIINESSDIDFLAIKNGLLCVCMWTEVSISAVTANPYSHTRSRTGA